MEGRSDVRKLQHQSLGGKASTDLVKERVEETQVKEDGLEKGRKEGKERK